MKKFPKVSSFKKTNVVMKKGIPAFHGLAATGSTSGVEFVIVCPDAVSCEEIWNLIMKIPLDRKGLQSVVITKKKDIEMEIVKDTTNSVEIKDRQWA